MVDLIKIFKTGRTHFFHPGMVISTGMGTGVTAPQISKMDPTTSLPKWEITKMDTVTMPQVGDVHMVRRRGEDNPLLTFC